MHIFKQSLEDSDIRLLPLVAAAPVQNQPLVGFDEEDTRTTRRVQDDLSAFLQPIKPLPIQRLLQHQAHEEWRRIDRTIGVLDKQLIDVTDQFNRKVLERIELPQRQLTTGLLAPFNEPGKADQLLATSQSFAVNVIEGKYMAVKALFQIFKQRHE